MNPAANIYRWKSIFKLENIRVKFVVQNSNKNSDIYDESNSTNVKQKLMETIYSNIDALWKEEKNYKF